MYNNYWRIKMQKMKKLNLSLLVENTIKETDMAIQVSEISDKLQKMIQDLSDTKVVDIAELVKQIKYDNNIEQAQQLEQQMGAKLDQAIETLTAVKSEIDNDVVRLFNGEGIDGTSSTEGQSDLDADISSLSGEDSFGDADLEDMEIDSEESADEDLDDLEGFDSVERTLK